MRDNKNTFLKTWLNNIFPSRCLLCQQTVASDFEVCATCYTALAINQAACVQCALPLANVVGEQPVTCGRCISQAPSYDYTIRLFLYQDKVKQLISQLKFYQKIGHARSMGTLLATSCSEQLIQVDERVDCIIPVPLHDTRLKQRGYNQSTELARSIAKQLNIPIIDDAVQRHKSTQSQAGLNAKQRKKNIKNAFEVIKKIDYKQVLIVDDVMTTGATVNELAKVLKKNKVTRVGVACFARAPQN